MRRVATALTLIAGVIAPAISASSSLADSHGKSPVTGIGIRLADIPTASANNPRALTYIIDRLAPGSTIQRRVEVTNGTGSTAQVSMYPAAASISSGTFVGADGHTPNDLSSWTSVSPASLSLEPREQKLVPVTIRVPANAAPGERYGVVWAEVTTPPQTPGGLTQVSRVGIRLYLSIGPGNAPASDFEIMSLTAARTDSGSPTVSAAIRNTGGRALDLTGELTLSDGPGGLSAGPFPVTGGTTLGTGQTEPVWVSLDEQLPDGPWLATITVRSGLTERTAEAMLTFPSGPGVGDSVAAETPTGFPWLTLGIGLAALLLILLVLVWYLLRRRSKAQREVESEQVAVGA